MKKMFNIVDDPICIEEVVKKVERREAGAITTFSGTVREFTKGKKHSICNMKPTFLWQRRS